MKEKVYYTIIVMLLTLSGCSTQKDPAELFEEYKSGVVLITNQYYFRMKMPNNNYTYFSCLDNNGNINFNTDYTELTKATISGTGFFIDKNGSIMTNRHVASPTIDKTEVKNQLNNLLDAFKAYYNEQLVSLQTQYSELEEQKKACIYYDYNDENYYIDEYKLNQIKEQQAEIQTNYNSIQESRDQIMDGNISLDELKIETVSKLGISYNDTYVSETYDLLEKNPCIVTKTSEKEDIDLAIIQLKNKKTPEDASIFSIEAENEEGTFDKILSSFDKNKHEFLQIEQELFMIGYNAGITLSNTKQGIKVQMTSGKVTQIPDGQRIMYSIPTFQGSSGSPIIDRYGKLQAVNYAKFSEDTNFNFGIPLNKIKAFMKEQ